MEQQERALAAYVESVRDEPGTLAVVVVGSVAQGRERPDSDVDVYLVVDEERFAAETAAGRFAWVDRWDLDYPGSYIDIKLASPAYLETAAERADDPTRASFLGARVAFSRLAGLESVIERITTLPDDVWSERVRSHVAQARLYGGYFLKQAVERGRRVPSSACRPPSLAGRGPRGTRVLSNAHAGAEVRLSAGAVRSHARRVRRGVGTGRRRPRHRDVPMCSWGSSTSGWAGISSATRPSRSSSVTTNSPGSAAGFPRSSGESA